MTVPGLTVLAVPHRLPGRAEQHQRGRARVEVHRHGPATGGADDHVGAVPVVLGLGGADGLVEVLVVEGRVDDLWPCSIR